MAKKSAKKSGAAKKAKKYYCADCGIVLSVDQECDCEETCDIICCGEQMKSK